ncbi:MAG: cytochrome b N-terminal domain-containing protein [Streptosporangiaceae bacterium]
MITVALAGHAPVAINVNQPGTYLNWWNGFITISVANLVLVAVMVAIFGAALLLPFPGRHRRVEPAQEATEPEPPAAYEAAEGDERMWTARLRKRALTSLPPNKLLPDRQPAYVASWVYVFGVGSLAALGVVIVSGFALALGGPDWWHTNPLGHFFNSLHLWSVELFMALLVIHLWGKFWMAAWRGRRTMTWITGVVAFLASVVECFTGYLSQQNFDSQWIATNGKDAFNAVGVGAFFNLMNFGQMLMWHIVLLPIILIAIIGAHVLLVRVRGVSHPLPATRPRGLAARRAAAKADRAAWRGPTKRYDILKEGTIATVVILVLTVGLASLLSSPDDPPVTVRSWVQVVPADFLATAATELDGTSLTASYGPPYNTSGTPQSEWFAPANWAGVRQPIDPAQTFVLGPLAKTAPTDPTLAAALAIYNAASPTQQAKWATNYGNAVTKVTFVNGTPVVPAASDGPVPVMLATELTLARSGGIDADLSGAQPFYGTDFTKPLLFLEDGAYYANQATAMHLTGDQWGVMNETGSYPGQPWLWLYQMWYHVPGWQNSANIDLIAIYMTGAATLLLLLIPFIPGLRDIPRWMPVHRLIWRNWNQQAASGPAGQPATGPKPEPAGQKLPEHDDQGPPPPAVTGLAWVRSGRPRLHPGLFPGGNDGRRTPPPGRRRLGR